MSANLTKQITIHVNGQDVQLPILEGSEKELAIDISQLRASTGLITLDNGYVNTGSCKSQITFLNGEKGILRYRGYSIAELAAKKSFLEVSWLLSHGELPNDIELKSYTGEISRWRELPDEIKTIMKALPKNMHPMAVLSTTVSALSGIFPEFVNPEISAEQGEKIACQLMTFCKSVVCNWYRLQKGMDFKASDPTLSYCEDFFSMMFDEKGKKVERFASALDVLFTLHADHEQNCSTSAVRLVSSSKACIYASMVGGINALWGPLHGGANQSVVEMLETIDGSGGDCQEYLKKAKDKADPFKLMGFGHRVYKNFDPRANIIKSHCDTVLQAAGSEDKLLKIAQILEAEALKDPYFIQRKLYPNVDFYSGILYRSFGIPTEFFTPMFVLGRLPGWFAHWKEQRMSADFKIGRPRQIYTGSTERPLQWSLKESS